MGLTTGEAHGDAAVLNPEQLLVMAASSCQMLWFLHVAAKARVDVIEYADAATGLMPMDVEPTRVTEITLRPRIVVASETTEARVRKLLHTAHEHCYIANSLTSSVAIEPEIELRALLTAQARAPLGSSTAWATRAAIASGVRPTSSRSSAGLPWVT